MPAYNSVNPPYVIWPGDTVTIQVPADAINVGFRTQQVAIGRREGEILTPYTVHVVFNQAPGTFELDVCESDQADVAGDYVEAVNGAITATDGSQAANPSARATFNASLARWVSCIWKTAPSNGGTTATISIRR